MAKRHNAKKEKADRNKINDRKFRKPPSRNSGKSRRYSNYNNNESGDKKSSDNDPDNPSSPEDKPR